MASASADISASAKVCTICRSKSGLAWDSCSAIQPGRSILGVAVIAYSSCRDLSQELSEDHAVAVSHHDATHINAGLAHHLQGRNSAVLLSFGRLRQGSTAW